MSDFLASIFVGIIIIIVSALLFSLPIMWLWNYLMPEIFGLTQIGFWQALAIGVLSKILFSSSSSSSDKKS